MSLHVTVIGFKSESDVQDRTCTNGTLVSRKEGTRHTQPVFARVYYNICFACKTPLSFACASVGLCCINLHVVKIDTTCVSVWNQFDLTATHRTLFRVYEILFHTLKTKRAVPAREQCGIGRRFKTNGTGSVIVEFAVKLSLNFIRMVDLIVGVPLLRRRLQRQISQTISSIVFFKKDCFDYMTKNFFCTAMHVIAHLLQCFACLSAKWRDRAPLFNFR